MGLHACGHLPHCLLLLVDAGLPLPALPHRYMLDGAVWLGAQVFFGWNLNAVSHGTVAVGDELIVKKKRTAALAA